MVKGNPRRDLCLRLTCGADSLDPLIEYGKEISHHGTISY
jgi:hypothetical protein